ncbi:MAG: hypothetical protein QF632_00455 [Candidatus Woesearchaeota archaeon]|jgi:hypothetical protein|nr:hypothetical protein [Candidatus Woesearchaeota archaeon]
MSNLNNNNLAILLVLTIVTVFAGTLFSLYRIDTIEGSMASVTGAATGTVSLSVSSTTFITISGTIDLGAIEPGQWNASENSSYSHGTSEYEDTHYNNTNVTSNFTVQNDGSVPIDIEVYDQNQTSDASGAGPFSGTGGCAATNTCYKVRCLTVQDNGTGGSQCVNGKQDNYIQMPIAAGTEFVVKLNYTDATDEAFFAINLTIPTDEPTRTLSQQITFAASAS